MSTVTDNDLKRLEDLIINGQKILETRLIVIETGQTEIKTSLKEIEKRLTFLEIEVAGVKGEINTLDEKLTGKINALDEKLTGKINALDERVTELGKRLENQEFVNRGILIALVVAVLGGFAKLFGFIGNL